MIMHADDERKPKSIGDSYRLSPGAASPIEHFRGRRRLRRKSWLRIVGPVMLVAFIGSIVVIHEESNAIGVALILALCVALLVYAIWRDR